MNKETIKNQVLKNGQEVYLSAQEFNSLTDNEVSLLKEVLTEEGKDFDGYEVRMRRLWPKAVPLTEVKWRRGKHGNL